MRIESMQTRTFWKGEAGVEGVVEDLGFKYRVRLEVKGSEIYSCSCSCGMKSTYARPCVHEKALFRYYLEHMDDNSPQPVSTSPQVRSMIREYTNREVAGISRKEGGGLVELIPRLLLQRQEIRVEFRVGIGRSYVVRDLSALAEAVEKGSYVEYGKGLAFYHSRDAFAENSRGLLDMVLELADSYKEHFHEFKKSVYAQAPPIRELNLSRGRRDRFFELLNGREIETEDRQGNRRQLLVCSGNPDFSVDVKRAGARGLRVSLDRDLVTFGGEKHLYVIKGGRLYICDEDFSRETEVFFGQMTQGYGAPYEVTVNEKDVPLFYERVLRKMENRGVLRHEGVDLESIRPEALKASFVLESPEPGRVVLRPSLSYGSFSFHPLEDGHVPPAIVRDVPGEFRVSQVLTKYFPYRDQQTNDLVIKDDEAAIFRLLSEGIGELKTLGEVLLADNMETLRVLPPREVSVGIQAAGDWLTLSVDAGDLSGAELSRILAAYREKKPYYRLKTGEFLQLADNGLLTVARMVDSIGVPGKYEAEDARNAVYSDGAAQSENGRSGEAGKTIFRVPRYRALYLDSLYRERHDIRLERDSHFKAVVRGMKSVEDSDFEVPEEFAKVLRGYQKIGFRWLRTLDFFGFGGILADDMGLGKTVQVISVIRDEVMREKRAAADVVPEEAGKCAAADAAPEEAENCVAAGAVPEEAGKNAAADAAPDAGAKDEALDAAGMTPSLIICPASLIYNWECEFMKFAPSLRVLLVTGSAAEREEKLRDTAAYDVVITSYDLLKRDLPLYERLYFRFHVIDEAQYIKNPSTQSARAVKAVHAQTRYALTGTPVENRLSELWSIFDFLMPGFLYSYQRFKERFESPIVRDGDEDALGMLRRMTGPFILRRLKKDVLKELPEKLETVVYSQMEGEQKELYSARALQLKETLEGRETENKIQILAALTRLRQICCDPRLIYDNYSGGSAKLETCMELLRSGVEAGYRILLFSQFTSMLELIRRRLDEAGIASLLLVGETSKEERQQRVNAFQRGEAPIFLISLKAGGTGLNLTRADMVIHYDPWWNVAAQNQAADRAHRIGQEKTVTVVQLITRGTIEENILKLQKAKAALADQVVTDENVSLGSLSFEEIAKLLE